MLGPNRAGPRHAEALDGGQQRHRHVLRPQAGVEPAVGDALGQPPAQDPGPLLLTLLQLAIADLPAGSSTRGDFGAPVPSGEHAPSMRRRCCRDIGKTYAETYVVFAEDWTRAGSSD